LAALAAPCVKPDKGLTCSSERLSMPQAGNQDRSRPIAWLRMVAALVNGGGRATVLGWRTMNAPPRWRDKKPSAWAPEQIVIGALVFAFGLLIGAGVAALLRPPG
jgi:hypothetical protein